MAHNDTTDARKLEELRKEAGRIAHDFNNLLTVISGHSSLLSATVPSSNPMYPSIAEIQKAGERAAVLVRELHELSREKKR